MLVLSSLMCQANLFIDRRFGEYDENLSLEEKMMKRFTLEKKVKENLQTFHVMIILGFNVIFFLKITCFCFTLLIFIA